MEITEHLTAIEHEARLFAEAARRAELDAAVPSCPGWDVRDLVRHLAEIHLWAAAQVTNRFLDLWFDDLADLSACWPELAVFWPSDEELIDWYLETNANLVRQLRSAPAALECPTFLPAPSPLAMWARRQAHETAVHRFDAEHAGHTETIFEPAFAADGIDEMLVGMAPRNGEFAIDRPATMLFHTNDTPDCWLVTLTPEGVTTIRRDGPADVTITGSATSLYLTVWNRGEDSTIDVAGDRDLLRTWHEGHRIRWTRGQAAQETA